MRQLDSTTVDRPDLPVTVLQFGGGNFLRAFVDWLIDRGNAAGVCRHGVAVVHVTDGPDWAVDQLAAQDGLFHVYLEGIKDRRPVKEVSLVTCVQEVLHAHGSPAEVEEYERLVVSPDLRIVVSNTTEAGIEYVPGDDLTARPPRSFPAKVTALLLARYRHFGGDPAAGLSFLCCELIEDNGSTLRAYVLRHAADNGLDAAFVDWVTDSCRFYDTLVDRIVPGFPRDDIGAIQAEIGYADQLVVKAEYFYVWAIGGDPSIRELLPLDRAGLNVLFMDDIRPFRAKKVRVLNGAHTALSAVGLQTGCETVRAAFAHPQVEAYVRALVADEVLPTIPGDRAGLAAFADTILERFDNPFLQHRLADICLNALSKWATRNLPVVIDRWAAGEQAHRSVLALAALLVLDSGRSANADFDPHDDPTALATIRGRFDRDDLPGWVGSALAVLPLPELGAGVAARLAHEVAGHVERILDDGMAAALAAVGDVGPVHRARSRSGATS